MKPRRGKNYLQDIALMMQKIRIKLPKIEENLPLNLLLGGNITAKYFNSGCFLQDVKVSSMVQRVRQKISAMVGGLTHLWSHPYLRLP